MRGGAGGRGKIEIGLRRVGENLEIRIEDNGPGIADAVRDKLFDPFVSHGKENGTGMGLTVVQKILQDHGGEVAVEQTSVCGDDVPHRCAVESGGGRCAGQARYVGGVASEEILASGTILVPGRGYE